MKPDTRSSAIEAIGFGIIAGILFAVVEVAAAVMMGNPPLMPFRMFASIILGQQALESVSPVAAALAGATVHVALSALFGFAYGLSNVRLSPRTQTDWSRQAAVGLLFGGLVWLVNFQLVARLLYPWFLEGPQRLQLLMHAIFFGLPLGLLYAGSHRRVRRPAAAA